MYFKPISPSNFNIELDGKRIQLFLLRNKNGLVSEITNFGGKVVSLWVPDCKGNLADIVLGFNSIDAYLKANEPYFGALIGRFGNRIAKGEFSLNAKKYKLATNNGPHHLHGGSKGFNAVVWDAIQLDEQTLELSYWAKDGEEAYPGNLSVKVIYTLTDENELKIEYSAITDETTIVNLTHHSFFNLAGEGNKSINNHVLLINANHFTPVDESLIPTGKLSTVENTPFDFRTAKPIQKDIETDDQQLKFGFGYDHNFVLDIPDSSKGKLNKAAEIYEPISRRKMEVWTTEPGLQFYGGNFLNGSDIGKIGKPYTFRSAFCLETQHFPDSPNQPDFPSTVLHSGELYHSITKYKFSVIA